MIGKSNTTQPMIQTNIPDDRLVIGAPNSMSPSPTYPPIASENQMQPRGKIRKMANSNARLCSTMNYYKDDIGNCNQC